MEKFAPKQRDRLADFFGNLAVAWIAAGIIAPAYNFTLPTSYRVLYLVSGIVVGWFFLNISLNLSKDV